jgi:hypothetical protein
VCVCSLRYSACNAHAPYCHLWPGPIFSIFPHSHKDFRKQLLKMYVLVLSTNLSETVFIPRRNERDMAQKCTLVFVKGTRYSGLILMKSEFSQQIFVKILKYQISWKSVQWEQSSSLLTEGRTDRHDVANSRSSQFSGRPSKVWRPTFQNMPLKIFKQTGIGWNRVVSISFCIMVTKLTS